MGRKPLVYTEEYPYHIMARSNNKEWFCIDLPTLWGLFSVELKRVCKEYGLLCHAFVLMNNHYHMLASTSGRYDIGEIMCVLQTSVSRKVNSLSGRNNHVFGGRYKASLIIEPSYYFYVFKYLYRNPIEAQLVERVEDYSLSTFTRSEDMPLVSPISGIASLIPEANLGDWINESEPTDFVESVRRGLKKIESNREIKESSSYRCWKFHTASRATCSLPRISMSRRLASKSKKSSLADADCRPFRLLEESTGTE